MLGSVYACLNSLGRLDVQPFGASFNWKENQFMKRRISSKPLRVLFAVTALALCAMTVAAQDSASPTINPPASASSTPAPKAVSQTVVELSFGVADVLKLSQAKVSENTIISYIQTSGRSYGGLSASEIVYLHEQGVSGRVVSTMLDQRNKFSAAAVQPTQANTNASTTQYPQAYVPPVTTYEQSAPASTVYVIPNSPTVVDYGYYPSYGYYDYYYPPVSFSFGFGGGYYGGR
jgi:hypothetical protein